nr:hypothetical protein [Tanacetum cinerariifolium]
MDIPLFEGMIVEQQVDKGNADEVHGEDVNTAEGAAKGVVSATDDVVPTADEEPSIPSPTPPTLPPQPFKMSLQHPKVEHLEQDKIAQSLEMTKLKQRVKKLERRNKERMIADLVKDFDVVLEEDKDVADIVKDAQDAESTHDHGRKAESQAEIYKIDLEHANKFLSMQEDESKPAEVQEVVEVVTTAKLITKVVTAANNTITAASTTITAAETQLPAATLTTTLSRVTTAHSRRRNRVVIRDPKESTTSTIILAETKSKDKGKGILDEVIDHVKRKAKEDPAVKRDPKESTTSTIILAETKSKDKGKGILVEKPKPLKKQAQIEKDEKYARVLKMDYFKGMSYDDMRHIFELKFNTNVAFLQKTKEQIGEEGSRALKRIKETPAEKAAKRKKLDEEVEDLKRHLQIVPNEEDDVYTEATPLALKVLVVEYEIYNEHNKPYYKIKRADGSHQLYLSFLSMLRNFDREDLEALWRLVKEIFATTKPKNFYDDFLLTTLIAMFEKPDIHAQI